MQSRNLTDEIPPGTDTAKVADHTIDRFYTLMKTLYSTVDPDGPTALSDCKTPDELRRAIEARAAKVRAVLKSRS